MKLYNPKNRKMRIAIFSTGLSPNLCNIIDYERNNDVNYKVVIIVTDRPSGINLRTGMYYHIPVIIKNIKTFYACRFKPKNNLDIREEFDRNILNALETYKIDTIVITNYKSIITKPIIDRYLSIGIRHIGLFICNNAEKYVKEIPIKHTIENKDKYLYSIIYNVDNRIDRGNIIMISSPMEITYKNNLCETLNYNINRLKETKDLEIFPTTLSLIANENIDRDRIYFYDEF